MKKNLLLLIFGISIVSINAIEADATYIVSTSCVNNETQDEYNNLIFSLVSENVTNDDTKNETYLMNSELCNEITNLDNLILNNNDKIYIYKDTNTNSEKIGVLSKYGIGEIIDEREFTSDIEKYLAEEPTWYKIKSGNITGYIKNDNLIKGSKAIEQINNLSNSTVKNASSSNVRMRVEPNTDCDVVEIISPNTVLNLKCDTYTFETSEWVLVSNSENEGYVKKEYLKLTTPTSVATKYEAPRPAQKKPQQNIQLPTNETPSAVVDYAMQFLGNPYVWGGTSLTNGCDCSGFVMSVYAAFGVSLPHSSRADRSVGYGVSYSEMQPGDIVCYDGHVGIYAGGGQIINALNRKSGIVLTNVNYDTILAIRRIF